MKWLLGSVVVALTALAASLGMAGGAEARSLDEIIKSGTIRIGVNPNSPPMSSYGQTNQFEGFDIDIANRIGEALKVKVDLVPTETAQRVPFLTSDRIDISLGALTRTSERAKLIDYTVPLHTESMAVLTTGKVQVDNWKQLDKPEVTLVDMRGNWTVEYLKKELPQAKMLLVETAADTVRALAQGRADVLVENLDFFIAFTKNYSNVNWHVLPQIVSTAYDAIGLQKGNEGLRGFLNVLLYELHSSGYINATWEKWFGAPMTVKVEPQPFF